MKNVYLSALKTMVLTGWVSVIILFFSILGIVLTYDEAKITSSSNFKQTPTVIIDPGHGGEDGGAQANGLLEKDINLSISNMLSSYIGLTDYNSVMTRNDDRMLYNPGEEHAKKRYDILNRIDFAENYDNAVFVSIHQNKFEIPKYKGLQVYYSPNSEDSEILAEIIQANAKKYLDSTNSRQIKKADYKIKVLNEIKIPAVLVECGFISNSDEAKLLGDYQYQKKLAFVIYVSIIDFLEK